MTPVEAVEKYLMCLKNGDLEGFPIAEDFLFEDPLTSGPQQGKAAFLEFIGAVLPLFRGVQIRKIVASGGDVAVHWNAHLVIGVIPVLELFRVENGVIREANALFDPRPITNPVAAGA